MMSKNAFNYLDTFLKCVGRILHFVYNICYLAVEKEYQLNILKRNYSNIYGFFGDF